MWPTDKGNRKVEGSERRLLVLGALYDINLIEQLGEGHHFEAKILHSIPPDEKIFMILRVLKKMTDGSPAPEIHAWNAAILGEMLSSASILIGEEIDLQEDDPGNPLAFLTRQALLDVAREEEDREDPLPRLKSKNYERWHDEIEIFSLAFVEDEDYLLYDQFADISPERVDQVKAFAGINTDYFAEAPEALTPAEQKDLTAFLDQLKKEAFDWSEHFKKTGKLV